MDYKIRRNLNREEKTVLAEEVASVILDDIDTAPLWIPPHRH